MFNWIRDFFAKLAVSRVRKTIMKLISSPTVEKLKKKYTYKFNLFKNTRFGKFFGDFIDEFDGVFICTEDFFNTVFTTIIPSKKIRFFNPKDFIEEDNLDDVVEIAFIMMEGIDKETEEAIYEKLSELGCKVVIRT